MAHLSKQEDQASANLNHRKDNLIAYQFYWMYNTTLLMSRCALVK